MNEKWQAQSASAVKLRGTMQCCTLVEGSSDTDHACRLVWEVAARGNLEFLKSGQVFHPAGTTLAFPFSPSPGRMDCKSGHMTSYRLDHWHSSRSTANLTQTSQTKLTPHTGLETRPDWASRSMRRNTNKEPLAWIVKEARSFFWSGVIFPTPYATIRYSYKRNVTNAVLKEARNTETENASPIRTRQQDARQTGRTRARPVTQEPKYAKQHPEVRIRWAGNAARQQRVRLSILVSWERQGIGASTPHNRPIPCSLPCPANERELTVIFGRRFVRR